MEPFRGLIFCTYFLMIGAAMNGSIEDSKNFRVGDHIGWQPPSINNTAVYSQWATSKRFHVVDSLSFEYQHDSVLVAEKSDYYHCNTNKPISFLNDGKTVANLVRPGLFYYISGAPDHRKRGQKLVIRVMGSHQTAESPPSIANAPEVDIPPGPHPSSGLVVIRTLSSVFVALIVTVVTLVLKEKGGTQANPVMKMSVQENDEAPVFWNHLLSFPMLSGI